MDTDSAGHGFARRKNDTSPARPVDPAVDDASAMHDETPQTAPETDASDPDQTDVTTPARPDRPAAPRHADDTPTTGSIPTEHYDAPLELDVYDVERHDRRSGEIATDEVPHRRRRTDAPPEQRRGPRRHGRAGWIAATIIFALLFGTAAALDWYLWTTSDEWEQHAAELTDVNYDLGERLSSEQQTTMQLTSEIDLLTQQLATSNQKVTDLSAQKADAVDESASYLQQIDALEVNLDSATGVANALHRCVDSQEELVAYLRDSDSYDPEDLDDFTESVRELCAPAEESNERLNETLSDS